MITFRTLLAAAVAVAVLGGLPGDASSQFRPRQGGRGGGTGGGAARRAERGLPEFTERLSRTLDLPGEGTIELSAVTGNVTITGGGSAVVLEAVKRVRSRTEQAGRTRLSEVSVEVRALGPRLVIDTDYGRDGRPGGVSVDYTLVVPESAGVIVKTGLGSIRIERVRGPVQAETARGNIEVTGTRRLQRLRSLSGDIRITNAEADDTLSLRTVAGAQIVRGLTARAIEAASVAGAVDIDGCTCERIDVRTVNGNIDYRGDLRRGGRYEFVSHDGDVRLALGGGGFELEAESVSGEVRSAFPLVNEGRAGPRRRQPGARGLRGAVGDAGAVLRLRSFSGAIVVERR